MYLLQLRIRSLVWRHVVPINRTMKTVPIQIPLTGEQWKQLDMISARQGFGPVEFVTNILLKELEKNQHLTRVAGKSKREYSHVPPCQIYQAS